MEAYSLPPTDGDANLRRPAGPTSQSYFRAALAIAEQAVATQDQVVQEAASLIASALAEGKRFWAFGSGHSHALVEEIYGRAGGLTAIEPILEPALMLHEGLAKSSLLERLPGYAEALLEVHAVQDGDVVLVVSNSGRNAVPVELAEISRARGAAVIALTSLAHSQSIESRAPSGRKLYEEADVVIDNCGVPGDAVLSNEPYPVGPTSTVVGALLVQGMMVQVTTLLQSRGLEVPILQSLNV